MGRKKSYRGGSRKSHSSNVTDAQLGVNRFNKKDLERTDRDAERHIFESSLTNGEKKLRFDYSDNVFSYRGDWESKIKVVKIFFPIRVNKQKCKRFEELVNLAFKTIFKT